MDYTAIIQELNQANAFELYRLYSAIRRELENPKRILMIKQKLRIGMELFYFEGSGNRLVPAQLLEMNLKNVVVLDRDQNKRFVIPYFMLNVDQANVDIQKQGETLNANTVKVGDSLGFNNRDGHPVIGVVQRLNHKTVTLRTNTGQTWRVGYSLLYRVHDADILRNEIPNHL